MKIVGIIGLAWLLAGCVMPQQTNPLKAFYPYRPRSIVVVPALNISPEITADAVLSSTVTRPLAERGYYVFPVHLTTTLLQDLGLTEAGHIHQVPASRFYEWFGADAVLFVTIKDWSSKYLVFASMVTVEMDYTLKDTKTGAVLWHGEQSIQEKSGGSTDIVSAVISATVNAMTTDYLPLARKANQQAFLPPHGLPAGPYHSEFQKDQDKF